MTESIEQKYLEKQIDATISLDEQRIEIQFPVPKIKLKDQLEINLIKSISPEFNREFQLIEDKLIIKLFPPENFHIFEMIHQQSMESRWRFAYNIIQTIRNHTLSRIKYVICPENIMFDEGLLPYFLHYGVKESIPPYETDRERTFQEMKATIAACVDEKYGFISYLLHYETLNLSNVINKIMAADDFEQLIAIVEEQLKENEEYERNVVHIPKKKWSITRYSVPGLALVLIVSVVYIVFAAFFKIPQTEAYVETNRQFLQNQYSSVIDTLQDYDLEDMPYVVQYQLAQSYLTYESLNEEQRKNILNTITLQSDQKYFEYWIQIGRGNYEEAIDVARILESRDLIMYGLLQEREAVKADESLSGEDREEKVNSINQELEAYQDEIDEENKLKEEEDQNTTIPSEESGSEEESTNGKAEDGEGNMSDPKREEKSKSNREDKTEDDEN